MAWLNLSKLEQLIAADQNFDGGKKEGVMIYYNHKRTGREMDNINRTQE